MSTTKPNNKNMKNPKPNLKNILLSTVAAFSIAGAAVSAITPDSAVKYKQIDSSGSNQIVQSIEAQSNNIYQVAGAYDHINKSFADAIKGMQARGMDSPSYYSSTGSFDNQIQDLVSSTYNDLFKTSPEMAKSPQVLELMEAQLNIELDKFATHTSSYTELDTEFFDNGKITVYTTALEPGDKNPNNSFYNAHPESIDFKNMPTLEEWMNNYYATQNPPDLNSKPSNS